MEMMNEGCGEVIRRDGPDEVTNASNEGLDEDGNGEDIREFLESSSNKKQTKHPNDTKHGEDVNYLGEALKIIFIVGPLHRSDFKDARRSVHERSRDDSSNDDGGSNELWDNVIMQGVGEDSIGGGKASIEKTEVFQFNIAGSVGRKDSTEVVDNNSCEDWTEDALGGDQTKDGSEAVPVEAREFSNHTETEAEWSSCRECRSQSLEEFLQQIGDFFVQDEVESNSKNCHDDDGIRENSFKNTNYFIQFC